MRLNNCAAWKSDYLAKEKTKNKASHFLIYDLYHHIVSSLLTYKIELALGIPLFACVQLGFITQLVEHRTGEASDIVFLGFLVVTIAHFSS